MADIRDSIHRWAITLVDPLFSDRERLQVREDLRAVVASDPQAVAAIIGNVAADIAATLPSNDPWRPGTNGASIITGTLSDQTDLIPPSLDEGTDPELASVAEGIESAVADLVRTAFVGGTELAESLLDAWPDHEEIVRRATDAVRWLLFRRRAYKGPTDLFVVECASAWATFMLCDAQRQHDLAEERETRVVEETISDLAYNPSERASELYRDFEVHDVAH